MEKSRKSAICERRYNLAGGHRFGGIVLVLCWLVAPSLLNAQTYLENIGVPSFSTTVPVEDGRINLANGNLHLEIPIGAYPQRGNATDKLVLMYDSAIWFPNQGKWSPTNISYGFGANAPWGQGGWRLVTSGDTGANGFGQLYSGWCTPADDYQWVTYSPWIWYAPDGTQHAFPVSTKEPLYPTNCPSGGISTARGYASDGSGFYISINNYTNATVYAPDGTTIYAPYGSGGNIGAVKTDPNGNQYTHSFSDNPSYDMKLIDTLGRNAVEVTENSSGTTIYYALPNASGGTSTYTVTLGTVNYSTAFGQTGVSEASGSFQAVTAIALPDGTSYSFTYDSGSSGNYGLLKSMTLPTGGTINYTFNNFTDGLGNVGRWINTRVTPDSSSSWSYSPSLISSCPSGKVNCKQKVTVTAPSGDSQVYTFTLNGGAWPISIQYNDVSQGQLASQSACYTFVSPNQPTCTYSIQTQSAATNVYRTSEQTTLGSASTTREYSWDPSNNGNLTKLAEWNFGNSPSNPADRTTAISYYSNGYVIDRPGTIAVKNSSGGIVAQTVNSYDGASLVTSGATGVAQHDDTNYGTGFTQRGNLTSVQHYKDASNYLTSSMTYDITGQMRTATDPAGDQTTFSYSDAFYTDTGNNAAPSTYAPSQATNAYLTSTTQASGTSVAETATFGYYWGTGQRAFAKDPNLQTTHFNFYDGLNRPTSTIFPDSGWRYLVYPSGSETQVDMGTGISSASLSTSCSTSGNACRHDQALMDRLGRVVSQSLVSDPGGQDTVTTAYDENGRVQTVTNPYRSLSDPTYGKITPTYDGLDRVTQAQEQDGSVIHIYYGAAVGSHGGRGSQLCSGAGYPVLRIDETTRPRQSWIDAFGRMIEVDEPDSAGTLSYGTCYTYDLNNNVTSIVQSSSRTRSFTYDFLSRLVSATNPESGQTYYDYMRPTYALCAGNLYLPCDRVDARGTEITFYYDALNRLTQKSYTDSTPTAYYYYDQTAPWGMSVSNPVGRLTTEGTWTSSSGWITSAAFSYDAMGRIISQWNCFVSSGSCTTQMNVGYDLLGDPVQVSYPSGTTTVNYAYNSAAQPVSAIDPWRSVNYATSAAYTPIGTLSSLTLGNAGSFTGINLSETYNSRLQPQESKAWSTAGTVMDLAYYFLDCCGRNNGNVTAVNNYLDSTRSQGFSYDWLNRISTAQASNYATSPAHCWGESYIYDNSSTEGQWGNLTNINLLSSAFNGCTQESLGVYINNFNQISSSGYQYDAAGNLTTIPSVGNYTYDAENNLISAGGLSYIYDANDVRSEKSDGTKYLFGPDGQVIDEANTSFTITNQYIYFNGMRIARRDASGNVTYYFGDQIGSSRVMTDSSGNLCYDADFYPFGGERAYTTTCSQKYKFTGQERDFESNLDNFTARHYTNQYGRFMSTDPLMGNIGDPQTLNRYAYVRNSPLTLTDPSGMDPCDNFGCGGGFPCDPDFGCDGPGPPIECHECDRQPPMSVPPGGGSAPNPPAGDPNPANDPFGGETLGLPSGAPAWGDFSSGFQNVPCIDDPEVCEQAGEEFIIRVIAWGTAAYEAIRTYLSRGKSDPIQGLRPFNPGRDEVGNCKPCPPDTAPWEASGNAHGSTSGSHWHWITWNQNPQTCICYPDRQSGPTKP